MNSRLLVALLFLLNIPLLAQADSYYDSRNGKRYLCTSVDQLPSLPSCVSECQHFDAFNNTCLYESSCDYQQNCLTAKTCSRFDPSSKTCKAEKTTLTCKSPDGGLLSCVEDCQHYDSFEGKCLYFTGCQIVGTCLMKRRCDRWDSFNSTCLTEKTETTCR